MVYVVMRMAGVALAAIVITLIYCHKTGRRNVGVTILKIVGIVLAVFLLIVGGFIAVLTYMLSPHEYNETGRIRAYLNTTYVCDEPVGVFFPESEARKATKPEEELTTMEAGTGFRIISLRWRVNPVSSSYYELTIKIQSGEHAGQLFTVFDYDVFEQDDNGQWKLLPTVHPADNP